MCQIEFYPVKSGNEYPKAVVRTYIGRENLLDFLWEQRKAWCEATDNKMDAVTVNLDLFFQDLIDYVDPKERIEE